MTGAKGVTATDAKQTVPLEKQSKKARRAFFASRRNDWNGVNPVTKVIPDKRKKMLREKHCENEGE
ncbi:MAG: hypothetical protein MJ142_06105 [Clostridia bacterium]|nr:hypothetical protein [Clostridia bacterium]